jgi:hypothetical protein
MTEEQPAGPAAAQPSQPPSLTLRIVRGVHTGAVTPLALSDMLVIGSSEDCDLILSDAGVARHHCIVSTQDGKLIVRAIDDKVLINGGKLRPGATLCIEPQTTVELGGAALVVLNCREGEQTGRPSDDLARPAQTAGLHALPPSVAALVRRYRWGILAGVIVLVVTAVALSPIMAHHGAQPAPGDPGANAVASAAPERPGSAVAHDVAEVLRLSGVTCEALYSGDGTVTVRGHLGSSQTLSGVIQSRAMREIVGLKRVMVLNLDHPDGTASGTNVDGTRIVSAVSSTDPYVVTADGSRYYVGASLPQGGRLTGVQEGEVLVERNGRIEHWKLSNFPAPRHTRQSAPAGDRSMIKVSQQEKRS